MNKMDLLNADEMAAFNRFCECCEDFDSGGYDVDKAMMLQLARIGVVRSTGFGRYETTKVGDIVRARRTPAAAEIAGELPPLLTDEQIEHLWARHADDAEPGKRRLAFGRAVESTVLAHYLRQQAALQEISDIGQEIEAGAAPADGDAIAKSKRILALVDTYVDRRDFGTGQAAAHARTDLRTALMNEFEAIADLRAQLAAKDQSQSFEQWWADQIKGNGGTPIGADYRHWAEKGYLAAPASAQPADPRIEAFYKLRDIAERDGDSESASVISTAIAKLGAQPDQRESALREAANFARCYDLGTPDGHAIADAIEAQLAAAPSPAAQPAKEIKDHNVRQLVNDLTAIGQKFGATQQLRSRISSAVTQFISAQYNWKVAAERRQGQDSANNSATGEKNAN